MSRVALKMLGWAGIATLFFAAHGATGQEKKTAYPFTFRDVTEETGLLPDVGGIRGHGAAWGDVDGDGWIDLYVATFHNEGSKANMLFRNHKGKFKLDDQKNMRVSMRGTGVVFADLDNDGKPDLYIGAMPAGKDSGLAKKAGYVFDPCSLFHNLGGGKFKNLTPGNGASPDAFGGRSVAVLDFDGDGLLDLLVGEDPIPGYNGSKTKSSRLFRNLGNMQFEDVTQAVGIPAGIPGLGVAAGDVNNDGWPDLFLACHNGGNLLFLNDGKGKFREAPGARDTFAWPTSKGENMICGVCFGDVNRDGLLDIVIGQHYSRPWIDPVPNRLYLNRGSTDGNPIFEDVTEKCGLTPLAMKAPHVEVQDLDNDGWPDIYTSQVRFKDGKTYPVIFKNLGIKDGLPRFREDASAVNDFPTGEDIAVKKTGAFFDKMIKDRKIVYMAPGPVGDFDNDGRLDIFLPNWWIEAPSLLLKNDTPGGNWLQVELACGKAKANQMGIGARINVYRAGKSGQKSHLLASREMAVGFGYASGQPAIAHFGLGDEKSVDLVIALPHGRGSIEQPAVSVNQRLKLKSGDMR